MFHIPVIFRCKHFPLTNTQKTVTQTSLLDKKIVLAVLGLFILMGVAISLVKKNWERTVYFKEDNRDEIGPRNALFNGKLHGKGTRFWKTTEEKQEGTFNNGLFVEGTWTLGSGVVKIGQFDERGLLQGQGKRVWSNGQIDEGLFKDGILQDQKNK